MSEELRPDFDFDASTAQAWALFADRLAEVVSVIEDGASLRIGTMSTDAEPSPYVSFTCGVRSQPEQQPDVVAEASSNASLGEGFQLGVAQLDQLEAMGWHAPSAEGDLPTANFWARHVQDDSTDLANLAVDTLRDVFGVQHPVFLAPDQLAEVLQPAEPQDVPLVEQVHQTDGVLAVMPHGKDELDRWITDELTRMFGHAPIRDQEGDFAIRVGSTMVFVRSVPDCSEILLFSALVHDVEGRSRAVEVLNYLNSESRFGRFALHRDRVYVSMSLLARPFVPVHLHEGVRVMSQIADLLDGELAAKLRGRTTFDEQD